MSRCFAYPPSCYQESLIDSIKLQKEIEKAKAKLEKKEKKKEKRERRKEENKEKKKKEKGDVASQEPEFLLPTEQKHGKRKFEENHPLERKSQFYTKKNNDGNDLFEGSGVTEEHESPCSTQHNYESSETSQDCRKRRKLPTPVLCDKNNGTILRIKLPASRPEVSGLTSLAVIGKKDSETKSSMPVSGQRDLNPESFPQSVVGQKKRHLKEGAEQPDTSKLKRKLEVAVATCEPHSRIKLARTINSEALYLSTGGRKDALPKPLSLSAKGQKDPELKPIPSFLPRQQNQEQIGKLKLERKVNDARTKNEPQPQINLSVARHRESEPVKGNKGFLQNEPLVVRQKNRERETMLHPVAAHKHREARDLRLRSEVKEAPGSSEQACFSGQIATAAQNVDLHRSSGSRSDVETFAEIVLNWKPPSIGFNSADICDEDWLSRDSKEHSNFCVNKCEVDAKALSSVGGCTSFLQPRASYLPELNMFMLPYTIPF